MSEQFEKELTGFPSQDRPWLKFFTEEQLSETIPHKSIYDYSYDNNVDHMGDVTFEYLGRQFTYSQLFNEIDKAIKAFESLGVKKGDMVTICSLTTPEIIYAYYALNKMGVIANMIDLRYTPQAIKEYLNEANSQVLIVLDAVWGLVKDIIDETPVKKIITVSPTNSASLLIRVLAKSKSKKLGIPYGDKYIGWNDFLKLGEGAELKEYEFENYQPALMIHTGGTTGVPKGVLLSNEGILTAVIQTKNGNCHTRRGYRFLNLMPPFIAYGVVLGITTPISQGWVTTIIPKFDVSQFEKLVIKHKPNGIMGVPAYVELLMKSPNADKMDLSFVEDILVGGDKIPGEFEIRVNKFLADHKSHGNLCKGYSMTEASSSTTVSSHVANAIGSVGVPLIKTVLAAFEPGTTNELPYNVPGEICFKTSSVMLGYYNNPEATKDILWEHPDGDKWIHSGDIGYVDEDGFVYIVDRIKRIIPRSGFKVFPAELENLFLGHEAVHQCVVVRVPDDKDVNAPMVHIVLSEEFKGQEAKIREELITMFNSSTLPQYFEPVGYKFRDRIPLTKIGKVDFVALENEGREE